MPARRIAAAALALACSADAFSFAPLPLAPSSRTSTSSLRPLGPALGLLCPERGGARRARGVRLSMQEDEEGEGGEGLNREQRRQAKKNKAKAANSQADKMNAVSGVAAESLERSQGGTPGFSSEAPSKIARPAALEGMRAQVEEVRENAIRQLADTKKGKKAKSSGGGLDDMFTGEAPLIAQMKKVDDSTLYIVENTLFYTAISAAVLWVIAGLCVAADSYLIATKRPVPEQFDAVLDKFVAPFLTPGLGAVLFCSLALGALQFIKFESGPTARPQAKNRKATKKGKGGGPLS